MELRLQGSRSSDRGFIAARCGKKKKKEVIFEIADVAGDSRLLKKVPSEHAARLRHHMEYPPPPLPIAVFASSEVEVVAVESVTTEMMRRSSITVVLPSRFKGPVSGQSYCPRTGFGKDVQYRHGFETRKYVKDMAVSTSNRLRGKRNGGTSYRGKPESWKNNRRCHRQFGWCPA